MKRKDPDVAAAFRKDRDEELFLEALNRALVPFETAAYQDVDLAAPLLFVMGVPRSGTTLLSQLLAFHLDVSYVDHLAAAFWKVPATGLRLSAKLLKRPPTSSFFSEFGRTREIHEPHEFGYFWSDLLEYPDLSEPDDDHEDRIDWRRYRTVLCNMSQAAGRVLMLKPFLLTWHLRRAVAAIPDTLVVRVERDPVDTALSLLQLRTRFLGSIDAWASLKPRAYRWLRERPVAEQLAGQVHFLDRALTTELEGIPERNQLTISYAEVCRDPGKILDRVRAALAGLGAEVAVRGVPPTSFELRCPRRHTESRWVEAVHAALVAITKETT